MARKTLRHDTNRHERHRSPARHEPARHDTTASLVVAGLVRSRVQGVEDAQKVKAHFTEEDAQEEGVTRICGIVATRK